MLRENSSARQYPIARWRIGGRRMPLLAFLSERAVEVEGGADQSQVGEGLRKVSERFADRSGLFGIESEVVGIPEHLLEDQPGAVELLAVEPAGAGHRLHQPEGAHIERSLHLVESVRQNAQKI